MRIAGHLPTSLLCILFVGLNAGCNKPEPRLKLDARVPGVAAPAEPTPTYSPAPMMSNLPVTDVPARQFRYGERAMIGMYLENNEGGALSPNGQLLALAGGAGGVQLIHVDTGKGVAWRQDLACIEPDRGYVGECKGLATFSNDGKKVVFTDEWGGGLGARCRATDPNKWGANAVFDLVDGKLNFASYYKMPAAQGDSENCVAHHGSLVPVPGRDIEVQAWYQGGISVMDFTDGKNPFEIAYFDRGPIDPKTLILGGDWSAYWYNGHIYGSEIARGLDVFELTPTKFLTQNEIDAAKTVQVPALNVQMQEKIRWGKQLVIAKAYLDQLERSNGLPAAEIASMRQAIAKAEASKSAKDLKSSAAAAEKAAKSTKNASDAARLNGIAEVFKQPAF